MIKTRLKRLGNSHKNILQKHLYEHSGIYIILIILFTAGFIIGTINASFAKENIKIESKNYILEFVEALKTQEIDNEILLKESISANAKPIIYIMLFGLILIGIPLIFIYIGLYSYSIGFTIASIFASLGIKQGIAFIFSIMLPQEIILLPTILIVSVNAILFSKTMLKMNFRTLDIKKEILKYSITFVTGILIAIGISFFETYVGSRLVKVVVNCMA